MRKLITAALSLLFLFGFAGFASAEIHIQLPKPVKAEKLARIFQEEMNSIAGLWGEVKTGYSYQPGSVKRVPERMYIDMYRLGKFFWMDDARPPFFRIEVIPGKEYSQLTVIDQYPRLHGGDEASTTNNYFKKFQPAFEELLRRVYQRLNEEK